MPRVFGVCPATIHLPRPATFSKSAKKFPKIGPGAYFPRQNVAPCGFNKKTFIGNKFYMHELHSSTRVTAGILSGRNNGLLSCYVEFSIRAKTGFSYVFFRASKLCSVTLFHSKGLFEFFFGGYPSIQTRFHSSFFF